MPADPVQPRNSPLRDIDLFQASPFLTGLIGEGALRASDRETVLDDRIPDLRDFRKDFRQALADPEKALLSLRQLRVRTLLAVARADIEDRIKPHQVRARLRSLAEVMVQGAWWLAETSLRERYVHPLILERRNINPPLAICSLSRLGSAEPWYTTGPAPIFVHSRAAEFAPALNEKDFTTARRAGKEWLPARDYFHRLARRTMSYLSMPDAAGRGFEHMAEDSEPDRPPLLPGALVILMSAFEEHFLRGRPIKERLSLMRLRFLVGQEKLGRAVEAAARTALIRTAAELGTRLPAGVNAWYRDRAKAEDLPLDRGGLLDIERRVRLLQFRYAFDNPDFMCPSPLKGLDRLAEAGLVGGEIRNVLHRAYSYQWFLANRLSLFGRRPALDRSDMISGRLDERIGLPGASERALAHMKEAREALAEISRTEGKAGAPADAGVDDR